MVIKSISLAIATLALSTSLNASVLNTLNGVDYEWLELSATAGMSRDQVEAAIAAASPGDALYGYEYASRSLVEDLLLSYTSWDGVDGWHTESAATTGNLAYLADFGTLGSGDYTTYYTDFDTLGVSFSYNKWLYSRALYGLGSECGDLSCISLFDVVLDDTSPVAARLHGFYGLDADRAAVATRGNTDTFIDTGSHLVRVSQVPLPSAVWLLGSGLIGLVGIARRKKA